MRPRGPLALRTDDVRARAPGNARRGPARLARRAQPRRARFELRLEDVDPERCTPEHAREMRAALGWLGLDWDVESLQSESREAHEAALDRLAASGLLYPVHVLAKRDRARTACAQRTAAGATPDAVGRARCRRAAGARRTARCGCACRKDRVELRDESGLDLSQDPLCRDGRPGAAQTRRRDRLPPGRGGRRRRLGNHADRARPRPRELDRDPRRAAARARRPDAELPPSLPAARGERRKAREAARLGRLARARLEQATGRASAGSSRRSRACARTRGRRPRASCWPTSTGNGCEATTSCSAFRRYDRGMDAFKDRVAVVTGGAGGIGSALARAFAARGAKIVLADLDAANLDVVVRAARGRRRAGARRADRRDEARRASRRWPRRHCRGSAPRTSSATTRASRPSARSRRRPRRTGSSP